MTKNNMTFSKTGGKHPFKVKDTVLVHNQVLTDNTLIKKAHVELEYTSEQSIELYRCRKDPVYFIENYTRIISVDEGLVPFKMYPYQKKMVENYAANKRCITVTLRQAGKTTVVAAFLLWYAIFHDEKEVAVLANKGAQAQEIMDRIRLMAENLPYFIMRGVKVFNKGTIVFDNDSKIFGAASGSSSIRGRSIALLYLDEMAFLAQDEEFWTSTMPVVSSGKDSRIIITSTPNGQRGVFYRVYQEAVAGTNGYNHLVVTWKEHPKRDQAWADRTKAEIGSSRFEQEFGCSFMGSAGTLIPADILAGLQFLNPESESNHLRVFKAAVPGRRYVMTVDCAEGLGQDYSTATIFDVTEKNFEQVAVYQNNTVSPILYPHVIMQLAMNYNDCPVIIEANNDVGGQVSYILYYELEYENVVLFKSDDKRGQREGGRRSTPGVKMNKKIKAMGCASLKTLLEKGMLVLNDMATISELGTFVAKGNSYEADDGAHDDLVMNLVLFAWFAKQDWFTDYCGNDLGNMIYEQGKEQMFESLLPVGFKTTFTPAETTFSGNTYNVTHGSSSGLEEWMRN